MGETKFCVKCGKSIPVDAEFCPYCGAPQPSVASTESKDTNSKPDVTKSTQPVKKANSIKTKSKKIWYKHWWVWAAFAVIVVGGGTAVYVATYDPLGGVDSSNATSSSSSESDQADTESEESESTDSSSDSSSKTTTLQDGTEVTAVKTASYSPELVDDSWNNSTLNIQQVNVIKTKPYEYDDDDAGTITEHGMVYIEFTYTPGIDVDTMVNEATISTNTGLQSNIDFMDSNIPDSIDKGVTKTIETLFPIESLDKPSEINSIRLKFPMSPSDTNSDDWKDYDLTINLTK